MDEVLRSTKDVIDALGGVRAVASLTGRNYPAAHAWLGMNRFPANTYLVLTAALHRDGKTAPPSLWGMAEAEPAE